MPNWLRSTRPHKVILNQGNGELERAEAAYKKCLLDLKGNPPLSAESAIRQQEPDDAGQIYVPNQASVASPQVPNWR